MADYKAVLIEKGPGGWGGPLTILPTDEKPLIYCVTGGGIHPIAARIAELTGGEVFDGFKSSAPFRENRGSGYRLWWHGTHRCVPDEEGQDRGHSRDQPRWPAGHVHHRRANGFRRKSRQHQADRLGS